jgi:hypothetical protein
VPNERLHIIIAHNPDCFTARMCAFNGRVFDRQIICSNRLQAIVPRKLKVKRLASDGNNASQMKGLLRILHFLYIRSHK